MLRQLATPDPTTVPPPEPSDVALVQQLATGHWASQITRTIAALGIPDHLVRGETTPGAVAHAAGSDLAATARLMRGAAALGLLVPDGAGGYQLTGAGQLLLHEPGSMRPVAMVQNAPAHWRLWGRLPDTVRRGTPPITEELGTSDLFTYLDREPAEGELFTQAMSGLTAVVIRDLVAAVDLGEARTVVDVGGAEGALVLALMQANPSIRGVVADRDAVMQDAEAAASSAGLQDRFEAIACDPLSGPVPPGDYFVLRTVLHDFSDDDCVTILRHVRHAGGPDARLLDVDWVLSGAVDDPAALADINMLVVTTGARERTMEELDVLFDQAGWRRDAVVGTATQFSLIEAVAVE